MNNAEKLMSVSLSEMDERYQRVVGIMDMLQKAKTKYYGNSCFRRSLTGLYHNIARKTDRLDSINASDPSIWEHPGKLKGETIIDTCADAAVYLIKMVAAYSASHPEVFESWEKSVKDFCEQSSQERQ